MTLNSKQLMTVIIVASLCTSHLTQAASAYSRSGGRRTPPDIENAIRVQNSEFNIKIKLSNGQLLVGNRKVVQLYRGSQNPEDSGNQSSSSSKSNTGRSGGSEYARTSSGTIPSEKRIVYEFLGIPFARPPTGSLRFQFPQRMTTILPNDKYNATYFRPSCYQVFS